MPPRGPPSGPSHRVSDFLTGLLARATQERYRKSRNLLNAHLAQIKCDFWSWTEEQQDWLLADILLEWRDDGVTRQTALDCIAMAQKMFGNRRRFKTAYSVMDGWAKEAPAVQATPMPEAVAFAVSVAMHTRGWHAEAFLTVIAFCGLLRIGEALALRTSDILLPAVHGFANAVVLLLRTTKCGQPDSDKVVLAAAPIVSYVEEYLRRYPPASEECLVAASTYSRFARRLEAAVSMLGFEKGTFRTHSLRRGGATALALAGLSMKDLMLAGRWASERSARLYIMRGEVTLLRMRSRVSGRQWDRIQVLARIGSRVFELLED